MTRLWEYKGSPGRLTLRVLERDPLSSSLQHPSLWTLLAVLDLSLLPFARVARSGRSGSWWSTEPFVKLEEDDPFDKDDGEEASARCETEDFLSALAGAGVGGGRT